MAITASMAAVCNPDRKCVIMVALPSTHSIVAIFGVKGTHQTSDDFPVAGHSIEMQP